MTVFIYKTAVGQIL